MKSIKGMIKGGLIGSLIGGANGLFGGGGGMIAVPLLKNALGRGEKEAHATAILLIAPVSAESAVIYFIKGYAVPAVFIPVAFGSVLGGILGARLLGKLPATAVNVIFTVVMFAAGVRMLFG